MQFAALQDLLFQDRHLKEVVLHLGEGVIARVVVGVREGKEDILVAPLWVVVDLPTYLLNR